MARKRSGTPKNDGAAPRKRASAAGPKAAQKRAAEERELGGRRHTSHEASAFLRGEKIDPRRIDGAETVGRAEHQGPEVDGECKLTDQGSFVLGDLVRCRVIAAEGVDLVVEPMELVAPAGGQQ